LLGHANRFINVAQCEVEMNTALAVAAQYATTGYDAQYIALVQNLNASLITQDRKLRKAVPGIAFSMQEFRARQYRVRRRLQMAQKTIEEQFEPDHFDPIDQKVYSLSLRTAL